MCECGGEGGRSVQITAWAGSEKGTHSCMLLDQSSSLNLHNVIQNWSIKSSVPRRINVIIPEQGVVLHTLPHLLPPELHATSAVRITVQS